VGNSQLTREAKLNFNYKKAILQQYATIEPEHRFQELPSYYQSST
jgi:hypothetical protein